MLLEIFKNVSPGAVEEVFLLFRFSGSVVPIRVDERGSIPAPPAVAPPLPNPPRQVREARQGGRLVGRQSPLLSQNQSKLFLEQARNRPGLQFAVERLPI